MTKEMTYMKMFKHTKTGKIWKLDENLDRHLIKDLEKDRYFKEMITE